MSCVTAVALADDDRPTSHSACKYTAHYVSPVRHEHWGVYAWNLIDMGHAVSRRGNLQYGVLTE
jgi:hypothetical protein